MILFVILMSFECYAPTPVPSNDNLLDIEENEWTVFDGYPNIYYTRIGDQIYSRNIGPGIGNDFTLRRLIGNTWTETSAQEERNVVYSIVSSRGDQGDWVRGDFAGLGKEYSYSVIGDDVYVSNHGDTSTLPEGTIIPLKIGEFTGGISRTITPITGEVQTQSGITTIDSDEYNRVIADATNNFNNLWQQTSDLFERDEDYEGAEERANDMLEAAVTDQQRETAYFLLAASQYKQGDYTTSEENFNNAYQQRIDEGDGTALLNRIDNILNIENPLGREIASVALGSIISSVQDEQKREDIIYELKGKLNDENEDVVAIAELYLEEILGTEEFQQALAEAGRVPTEEAFETKAEEAVPTEPTRGPTVEVAPPPELPDQNEIANDAATRAFEAYEDAAEADEIAASTIAGAQWDIDYTQEQLSRGEITRGEADATIAQAEATIATVQADADIAHARADLADVIATAEGTRADAMEDFEYGEIGADELSDIIIEINAAIAAAQEQANAAIAAAEAAAAQAAADFVDAFTAEAAARERAEIFSAIEQTLTEFQGLSYYSPYMFGDDFVEEWRESIDRFFDNFFLGGTDYWVSALCMNHYETKDEDYSAVYVTPGGQVVEAAHVEGERSSGLPKACPCSEGETCRNLICYDANDNIISEYFYKLTFFATAVEDDNKFNVYVTGPSGTRYIFSSKIELKKGKSFYATGANAIVQYSSNLYNKICIVFDDDIPIGRGFFRRYEDEEDEFCNSIPVSDTSYDIHSEVGGGTGASAPTINPI